jgi:hypothetical protein
VSPAVPVLIIGCATATAASAATIVPIVPDIAIITRPTIPSIVSIAPIVSIGTIIAVVAIPRARLLLGSCGLATTAVSGVAFATRRSEWRCRL